MSDNHCAKCGACTSVCPVYQVTGQESLTARGRLHLLERLGDEKYSQTYRDIFSKCLLCDACHQVCPQNIDLPAEVAGNRSKYNQSTGKSYLTRAVIKKCLSHSAILASIGKLIKTSAPLLEKIPLDSGLRLRIGLPAPKYRHDKTPEKINHESQAPVSFKKTMLFPGCLARHLYPDITSAATELISTGQDGIPDIPGSQACCGLVFYSSGEISLARHLARLNIWAFEGTNTPIVVLCGSCFSHLSSYPDLLGDDNEWHTKAISFAARLREFSSFLTELPESDKILPENTSTARAGKRIVYHDPCHNRYNPEIGLRARKLIKDLPGTELVELANGPQCCGSGGLFHLAHPEIAEKITANLVRDIIAAEPDLVTTTCSACLIHLKQQLAAANSRCMVIHLALLLDENKK